LFVDGGSGGYYVRLLGQFVEEWTPIADAVALYSEKADVAVEPSRRDCSLGGTVVDARLR